MINLPTLRQIQFLLALKQHNSFHAAATACGVTQSTLSAGIQDMEAILGQAVIDRTNRRTLIFTPLGLDMLEYGQNALASLSDITERARHRQQPLSWPLKIGIIPTIAPYLLPDILPPLHKKFPQMTLQVHEVQSAALVDAVQAGELDCGIMAFPFQIKDLQQQILREEKFVCAAPKDLFADKDKITVKQMEEHPLLLLSDGNCLRDHALAACKLSKIATAQNISATSLSTIIQLVANGYGLTLLPEMAVKSTPLPKNVRILPFSPSSSRQIGLVWRKNAAIQNDLVTLAKTLKEILKAA